MSKVFNSIVLSAAAAVVVVLPFSGHSAASVNVANGEAETTASVRAIKDVLKAQVTAWNSGDVPGFMEGYVKTSELRFASGDSVTQGWQPTLDRYLKRYDNPEIMGTLKFGDLKVLPLSSDYAEVFGRWHLARTKEVGNASGLFTLLMKKTSSGWRVLHDHTSSAEKE